MAIEPVISLLRIRVVATFNSGNKEITNNLPHLHQTHIDVVAMQPGNPGSTALGSWSCQLHPPGSEGYAAAKATYDQIDYGQRLEFYISHDGQSLGKLYYAGIITGIRKGLGQNPVFELTGVSDLFWLNYSRPWPGESFQLSYGTGLTVTADYRQAHNYFSTNELGAADNFNPFTAGNYNSTNLPSLTSGTWTSTTDDGLNVVTCSTGSGAILISKTGAQAACQTNRVFVEATMRLLPSADATNAGGCGVGLTLNNANGTDSNVGWVRAKKNASTGHWDLDCIVNAYVAGVLTQTVASSALTSTEDPDGYITVSIGLLWPSGAAAGNNQGVSLTVNGKAIFWAGGTIANGRGDPGTSTTYPFVMFATPATGTANAYITNLTQQVRYSDDLNSGTAIFKPGTIGTPAHSLPLYTQVDPTFLEVITRVANRESWYWRYTPQTYVVGTRTIGTIDLTSDPGTDRGTNKSVVFSRLDGSLIDLQLSANADQFVSGTTSSGPPGNDSGGIAYWRDVSTMSKYGVIDDQILAVTVPNHAEMRRMALSVSSNRINLGPSGSKTATILRDPKTADVWRELDKVMIHDPELGINYLVARVMGYTFDEGQGTQTLTLDQFGIDDPTVPMRRLQQGVFQAAKLFNTR